MELRIDNEPVSPEALDQQIDLSRDTVIELLSIVNGVPIAVELSPDLQPLADNKEMIILGITDTQTPRHVRGWELLATIVEQYPAFEAGLATQPATITMNFSVDVCLFSN